MSKLTELLNIEGLDDETMFEAAMDSVQPGICMNEGCDQTAQVEPDCDKGFCEGCGTQTVKSLSMLLGVI